jgi:hypothetical protein
MTPRPVRPCSLLIRTASIAVRRLAAGVRAVLAEVSAGIQPGLWKELALATLGTTRLPPGRWTTGYRPSGKCQCFRNSPQKVFVRPRSTGRAAPDGTRSQPEVEAEPHSQQEHRAGHHDEPVQPYCPRPVFERVPDHSRPPRLRLGRGLGPGLRGDCLTPRGHRAFLMHAEENTALPGR